MLETLILTFLFILTILLALFGGAVLLFSWQLNRSNRVVPDVETTAPLLWLWAPTQPARMHRRLRTAVAPVYASVPKQTRRPKRRSADGAPPSPITEMNRSLVDTAVALDRDIVASARMPRPHRRLALQGIQPAVTQVEQLSMRIVAHQRRVNTPAFIPNDPPPTPPAVLADLSHQLDLLDQAHGELQEIEQASGLLDPDVLMGNVAPRPAPIPRPAPGPRPVSAAPSGPPTGPPLAGPGPIGVPGQPPLAPDPAQAVDPPRGTPSAH